MAMETSAIHVPQHLVDLVVAYNPSSDGYIRNLVFPRKDVQHEVDLIPTIDTAATLRLHDIDVSGRAEIPEVSLKIGADLQYRCKGIAAKHEINPKDVKNADVAYQFEKRATRQATISVSLRMEHLAVKQTLRNTAVMTNYVTRSSGSRWDDFGAGGSDPIGDLLAAVSAIRIKTGTPVGGRGDGTKIRVFMHQYAWNALIRNQAIGYYLAQSPGSPLRLLTRQILGEILELPAEDIVVTSSRYTSSQEGAATDTFCSFIGSDCVVALCSSDPENDQALGHEFCFDGLAGEEPFLVTTWRQQGVGVYQYTDWVGVSCLTDYKITNPLAGYLIQSVIDPTNSAYGGEVD